MLTFRNYNIADWFSFFRILATPFLLILALLQYREAFSILLLISYSTDMIDGFLARKLKITSPRGSQLDSIGDQLTFTMGLTGLVVFEYDFILDNIGWIIVAFIPYLFQMLLAWRKYGKATAFHTYLAKLSALMQGAFILWALFFEPVYALFYAMLVFGVIETVEEIILIFMVDTWRSDIKGVYWVVRSRKTKGDGK